MIILSGRYLVGELVYGDPAVAVHRGHDQVLDRAVTIELLQPGAGAEVATALRDKARRMALVELPHVAALYDQGDEEGRPYLVLEELLGEALADVAPLPSAGAASLVSSLATTLAAAHERRAPVPRIDRGSVRVVDDARIQIIDWGVSQSREAAGPESMRALVVALALAVTGSEDGRARGPVPGPLMRVVQEALAGRYTTPAMLEDAVRQALRVSEDPTVIVGPRGRPTVMVGDSPPGARVTADPQPASVQRRRFNPLLLGVGIALLAALLAGGAALRRGSGAGAEEAAAPTAPVVTVTAEPDAPAPTSTAAATPERGTPFVVNTVGRTRLNVRAGPSQNAAIVGKLVYGSPVEVVEGPVEAGGYRWVRITSEEASGWCILEALQAR